VSSTLLGSPDFIAFIKDKFLLGKKPDKELPALKELIDKVSLKDICNRSRFTVIRCPKHAAQAPALRGGDMPLDQPIVWPVDG